ncbi:MAG TPA: hypothetical protein VGL09_22505 [Methylomirabilota bacterium]|jgi:hypothetical protein
MSAILHLVKDEAPLARFVIADQVARGDVVTVAVLEGAGDPAGLPAAVTVRHVSRDLSYPELLRLVFAAEQVIAW